MTTHVSVMRSDYQTSPALYSFEDEDVAQEFIDAVNELEYYYADKIDGPPKFWPVTAETLQDTLCDDFNHCEEE